VLEVTLDARGHVVSEIDQAVVNLAAHEQRPMLTALLQVLGVGARDLDCPQHLQAEQRQQGTKLGVNTRRAAVHRAEELGLLSHTPQVLIRPASFIARGHLDTARA
jgi:hypothetical protein